MSSIREELGVDPATYQWLNDWSQGKCWICRHPESVDGRSLAVDHDHRTGAVRGLLCTGCNLRLGTTVDPEWLWRAAAYLARASRAFGQSCEICHTPTESRLMSTDGQWTRFRHTCHVCGTSETMGYRTHGVPFSWENAGAPPATRWKPLRPAEEAGFCYELPTEPPWSHEKASQHE